MTTPQEVTRLKADAVYYARLISRFRDAVINAVSGFKDEGDRVYFNSTNDADALRDVVADLDNVEWERLMRSASAPRDLYSDLRGLRARVAELEALLTALQSPTVKLKIEGAE